MDFLKSTHTQISPLIQSVGATHRNMLVMLVVLVIGGVAWYLHSNRDDKQVFLYGGRDFSPAEIGSMETALGRAGIEDYEVIENRIRIKQSLRADVLRVIADADSVPKCISGYEPAASGFSPFMTGAQQRNIEKTKKQDKICAMIREIKGISDVMVEYDESRSSGFPRTTVRTAAVSVRPDGQRHLEKYEVETIRSMVKRAVAGLQSEDIVVIDGNSGVAHEWNSQQQQDAKETVKVDYASAKQRFEEIWKRKVQNVLKSYPDAQVSVQVQLQQVAALSQPGKVSVKKVAAQIPTATQADRNGFSFAPPPVRVSANPGSKNSSSRKPSSRNPRAVAHFRTSQPGSNGQARIQEFDFKAEVDGGNEAEYGMEAEEDLPSAVQQASLFGTQSVRTQPVSIQAATEFSSIPKSMQPDFIPRSASVSVSIPEAWIRKLARQRKVAMLLASQDLDRTNQPSFADAADSETDPLNLSPSILEQQITVTTADLQFCYSKVQQDITQRIAPLLPRNDSDQDISQLIAVSLDRDPDSGTTNAESGNQPASNEWLAFASKLDLVQLKQNWYTWAIPLVAVLGLALMWASNRASSSAERQRRQDAIAAQLNQQAASQRMQNSSMDVERNDIEHNDLEPSEQEVKLATDIDRAFDNDSQSNLSKEVVEMIQNDPATTVKVFRSWLSETS